MISNSTQTWEVGESVKVGFLSLRILAKVATPGDYAPDAYVMCNKAGDKFYRFVPHKGLQGGFRDMQAAMNSSSRNWQSPL